MKGKTMSELSEIVGKTPNKITVTEDEILFEFSDGSVGRFYHYQDCCEIVTVDDVNGDWEDLIGTPLLVADERQSDDHNGVRPEGLPVVGDSNTWTFYTFRSIWGSVDVRWHGYSNGYYSERVGFDLTGP